MDFKPGKGKVLVKLTDADTVTTGGIVLVNDAVEKPNQAVVLAVGSGQVTDLGVTIDIPVKVGDQIMFGKGAGQAVRFDGQDMLVLREEDIFAIVE